MNQKHELVTSETISFVCWTGVQLVATCHPRIFFCSHLHNNEGGLLHPERILGIDIRPLMENHADISI